MKLNLLPTTVSTANRSRGAIIGSILLVALAGAGTAALATISTRALEAAKTSEAEAAPKAANAVTVAKQADTAAAIPEIKALVTNVALAKAMLAHNPRYPQLYNDVKPYIPAFFRITSLTATPVDDKTAAISMQGVVRTYQEYADLMLSLLRIPGARSVSRNGFGGVESYVPPVTELDQNGRPRKPGETPVPDDPLERLTYFENLPAEQPYVQSGGFGAGQPGLRTITPNASLITVQVVIDRVLQTPNPRATLASIGAAAAPGAVPATATFNPDDQRGPSTAPPATPSGRPTSAGAGAGEEDER